MEPLFQTSLWGMFQIKVLPHYINYKPFFFSGETSIPLEQIASVQRGMAGVQKITIETTGGKKVEMVVRLRDKEKLYNTILSAKSQLRS
jgi:hypothetical protein